MFDYEKRSYLFPVTIVFLLLLSYSTFAVDFKVINTDVDLNKGVQYNLALTYYYGTPQTPVEKQRAFFWFMKAADENVVEAQYNLGIMYRLGEGTSANPQEAVKWITKAAESGLTVAENTLGLMYQSGDGIKVDAEKALYWLTKAKEPAINTVKQKTITSSDITEKEKTKVLNTDVTIQKAANKNEVTKKIVVTKNQPIIANSIKQTKNNKTSLSSSVFIAPDIPTIDLSSLNFENNPVNDDIVDTDNRIEKEENDTLSMADLNVSSNTADINSLINYRKQDIDTLKKQASSGDAMALYVLGEKYEKGEGTPYDIEKAAYLYKLSAKRNNSFAQNSLGYLYEQGLGVKEDQKQALIWYQKAAENMNPEGQYSIGNLHNKLAKKDRDESQYIQAYAWFAVAEKNGFKRAGTEKTKIYLLALRTPERKEQARLLAEEYLKKYAY